ncbi:unnamed protein product [Ambrosiozyma monospora]|uniref:Unnamed protein product n=1 Tax=Ambrosiozyma monospora TaxID=43982 RepID=A0ACB5TQD6_AMBMO|nr:unnamed protein product [Ambrosiozyma monospora]
MSDYNGQSPFIAPQFPQEPAPKVPWSATLTDIIFKTSFIAIILVIVIHQGSRRYCYRFFVQPPDNYIDNVIKPQIDAKQGSLKKTQVGVKHSSFRRRFIQAAVNPQLYSTMPLTSSQTQSKADSKSSSTTTAKKPANNSVDLQRIAKVDIEPKSQKQHFLNQLKPKLPDDPTRRILFGFFHPYADANGGGERVLWDAVHETLLADKRYVTMIYTFTSTQDKSVSAMLTEVKSVFGIDLFKEQMNNRVVFIQLPNKYRWLIDGSSYKMLTIIGQALGSIATFWMAVYHCSPDIFIDTLGLPFTYPFASFFLGVPVVSYTHYPLISGDMLNKLGNPLGKNPYVLAKFLYWKFMMKLYAICGAFTDITVCNSTWTVNHIKNAWSWIDETNAPSILYPSTGLDETKIADPVNSVKERKFLFVAQFRPEKRHELLLKELMN